ncbi:MAG: T9SS type A sorting domain-containing protein [Candidatus Cloacimonetes bacterium]|nr:T9SS type A sorting domain-containing protein [Candidatus Cloacimonadota bacterium]
MKRIVIPLLFVFLFTANLLCIDVSGSVSGVWTLAQSPVNVIGDIYISAGNQLVINPGVEIIFTAHYKFDVYGRILAQGLDTGYILFTAQNTTAGWHSLRFHDTNTNGQDASLLDYCILEYGKAISSRFDYQGGAIYCENSSDLLIQNSLIRYNEATTGGAIYLINSSITINATEIMDNNADGAGGGIYIRDSYPVLTDVRIINNTALYDGGGINCFNSDPLLTKCTFSGNLTQWNGGAISCANYSAPIMINNTLFDNIAYQDGCGIAVLYNGTLTLMNSILWENDNHEIFIASSAEMTISYCDIMDGQEDINIHPGGILNWLNGNINADPLFIDSAANDFNLEINSPCIDAGNPDPIYNDEDGTRNDMGAYSFLQTGLRGNIEIAGGNGDVEDVIVTISGDTLVTVNPNVMGNWFMILNPGTYNVTAELTGYQPNPLAYEDLELGEGELISNLDFVMTEIIPGVINGIISLEIGAVGDISQAEITAGDVMVHPFFLIYPYEHWEYNLTITPGIYDVTASLVGFSDSTYTDVVVEPSTITSGIDFVLEVMDYIGYVQGTVTLMGGDGNVEDVLVSDEQGNTTNPDSEGLYLLQTTNGLHDITASLEGYTTVTLEDILVTVDQTTTGVDITLLPWQTIQGNQYVMTVFATATLNGKFICDDLSNQVGAFWVDQLSEEEECRGVALWVEGNPPEWESSNPWDIPGYWYFTIVSNNNSGEVIEFRLFESYTNTIYTLEETIIFEDCTYDEAISIHLTVPSPTVEQYFDLIADWDWISFNLKPLDSSLYPVFDQLTPDYIVQVKEQYATAYFEDPVWVGDLTNIHIDEGYKLFLTQSYDGFVFSGTKINPIITPIPLDYVEDQDNNWNWVPYLPETVLTLEQALDPVESSIRYIKTQYTSAFNDGGTWIGDLEELEPGKMYIIDLKQELGALIYPGTGNLCFQGYERDNTFSVTRSEQIDNQAGWDIITGNRSNMIVMAEAVILNSELEPDNILIGVFDNEGNCHSLGKAYDNFWYFTIRGNDSGVELHFRIFDIDNNREVTGNESFIFVMDTALGTPQEPLLISFDYSAPSIPALLILHQNYPNPFNPNTVISYILPEDTKVRLEVFNIKGELVSVLINTTQQAGFHAFEWDASGLSSGIYYYKITTDTESMYRKCLLIK